MCQHLAQRGVHTLLYEHLIQAYEHVFQAESDGFRSHSDLIGPEFAHRRAIMPCSFMPPLLAPCFDPRSYISTTLPLPAGRATDRYIDRYGRWRMNTCVNTSGRV